MIGHERRTVRHYLKDRPPTAEVGLIRLNQCLLEKSALVERLLSTYEHNAIADQKTET